MEIVKSPFASVGTLLDHAEEKHSTTQFTILTVGEVANQLRCSKANVHNLINGKVPKVSPLPALALGRRRLVRRASLERWMQENEQWQCYPSVIARS